MTRAQDLRAYVSQLPVVSSHSHHGRPEQHKGLDLTRAVGSSYVGWCGVDCGVTDDDHGRFLDQVGANTYMVWLSKALDALYGLGEVSVENWDAISSAMVAAHEDPERHFALLRDKCRYKFAVQDCYWDPGDDLDRPDLFRPTFRINSWVVCHHARLVDHNGNTPWTGAGFDPKTLDEYLDILESGIAKAVTDGAVAIKSALAYERTQSFANPDIAAARRAFRQPAAAVERADVLAFGDVVMHHICRVAATLQVPLQVHLGLGQIAGSRPMLFEPVIAAHPDTVFDLFHCGYPWCDEIGGLLHNYGNVVADLCWLPLISTTVAVRALHEYLDVARSSDRIIWGDDTWTGEEAYGAVLAWEHVVSKVLAERVTDGLCSTAQAERLAEKLMSANAERVFAR